ncbi:hypothetical protein FRB91_000928 [Serendipita sp. 411]|nr:hypothetical protein FRB91_000928 [Serendipita sp. 411]
MLRSPLAFRYIVRPSTWVIRQKSTASSNRRLTNADIPHEFVKLVQEDGKLSEQPVKLASLLQSINQSTYFIELVSEQGSPIVRIKNKKEAMKQEREMKEKKLANRVVIKQIQVSWVISDGDLQHKMSQARKYIEKGDRVWVIYSSKPGQVPPPAQNCTSLVEKVHVLMDDIASVIRVDRLGKSVTSHTTVQYAPKKQNK